MPLRQSDQGEAPQKEARACELKEAHGGAAPYTYMLGHHGYKTHMDRLVSMMAPQWLAGLPFNLYSSYEYRFPAQGVLESETFAEG